MPISITPCGIFSLCKCVLFTVPSRVEYNQRKAYGDHDSQALHEPNLIVTSYGQFTI